MRTNRSPISIATAGSENNCPRIRILIANDHLLFRDGMRHLLSAVPDFNVVAEAREDAEVLAMTARFRPDVILLDIAMSGCNGSVTLQRLRSEHPGVKVILLTSSEEPLPAIRFRTAGIVNKSTTTELLIKSIRNAHADEARRPRRIAPREDGARALSPREREIVALVARGYRNKDMAEKMFISQQTVKNHLYNVFDKLGVSDRLELALHAIYNNLH